ncbi:hypothetical protein FEM03_18970 [Phragmitibacter flavus]|uniref:DUF2946 domain-containing protein n=1 Tax=Phragmitibacter flavus TaxID=2576071 RepID=A0A5R8KA35_9BACT|nr:hypothetical protein [Phragmitibacter flavus]TLD69183.1 hypothetical protein FEM03_18970 [Phragmitibacter flavus]
MQTIARASIAAALMITIGLHWSALQMVAWATMLPDYTAEQGLIEGIANTFNGTQPCPMCRQIAASQKSDPQSSAPTPNSNSRKLDSTAPKWISERRNLPSFHPRATNFQAQPHPALIHLLATQWHSRPPTPPPRPSAC